MEWQTLRDEPSLEADEIGFDDSAAELYAWRLEQLVRAGYSAAHAGELADDNCVDLHHACDLLRRGCPEATAFAILAASG
jgi:hypothetical protein